MNPPGPAGRTLLDDLRDRPEAMLEYLTRLRRAGVPIWPQVAGLDLTAEERAMVAQFMYARLAACTHGWVALNHDPRLDVPPNAVDFEGAMTDDRKPVAAACGFNRTRDPPRPGVDGRLPAGRGRLGRRPRR